MTARNQHLRVSENLNALEALQVTLSRALKIEETAKLSGKENTYDAGLKVADHGAH